MQAEEVPVRRSNRAALNEYGPQNEQEQQFPVL